MFCLGCSSIFAGTAALVNFVINRYSVPCATEITYSQAVKRKSLYRLDLSKSTMSVHAG